MKENFAVSPVDGTRVPTLFSFDDMRLSLSHKERFLHSLKSGGKQDYKRYLGSPPALCRREKKPRCGLCR